MDMVLVDAGAGRVLDCAVIHIACCAASDLRCEAMVFCVQDPIGQGNRMKRKTILYVSNQASSGNAVSDALQAAGYEVVTTNTIDAVALLYILHSIAAVVLRAREQAGLDVRNIRAMCPDVPIVLLYRGRTKFVPSRVDSGDAYVATVQSLATVAAAVRRLVAKKPATSCPRRPESSGKRGR